MYSRNFKIKKIFEVPPIIANKGEIENTIIQVVKKPEDLEGFIQSNNNNPEVLFCLAAMIGNRPQLFAPDIMLIHMLFKNIAENEANNQELRANAYFYLGIIHGNYNIAAAAGLYNENEAFLCYRNAANLGNSNAWFNLGYCHYNARGTFEDKDEAFRCYEEAGKLGNRHAFYNLAFFKSLRGSKWFDPEAALNNCKAGIKAGDFRCGRLFEQRVASLLDDSVVEEFRSFCHEEELLKKGEFEAIIQSLNAEKEELLEYTRKLDGDLKDRQQEAENAKKQLAKMSTVAPRRGLRRAPRNSQIPPVSNFKTVETFDVMSSARPIDPEKIVIAPQVSKIEVKDIAPIEDITKFLEKTTDITVDEDIQSIQTCLEEAIEAKSKIEQCKIATKEQMTETLAEKPFETIDDTQFEQLMTPYSEEYIKEKLEQERIERRTIREEERKRKAEIKREREEKRAIREEKKKQRELELQLEKQRIAEEQQREILRKKEERKLAEEKKKAEIERKKKAEEDALEAEFQELAALNPHPQPRMMNTVAQTKPAKRNKGRTYTKHLLPNNSHMSNIFVSGSGLKKPIPTNDLTRSHFVENFDSDKIERDSRMVANELGLDGKGEVELWAMYDERDKIVDGKDKVKSLRALKEMTAIIEELKSIDDMSIDGVLKMGEAVLRLQSLSGRILTNEMQNSK